MRIHSQDNQMQESLRVCIDKDFYETFLYETFVQLHYEAFSAKPLVGNPAWNFGIEELHETFTTKLSFYETKKGSSRVSRGRTFFLECSGQPTDTKNTSN
jgi:hypothetical protein